MNEKRISIDPIPIQASKEVFCELLPYNLEIVNMSLLQDVFSAELKHTPMTKDTGADSDNVKNYRPISNTPIQAKIIDNAALYRINAYLVQDNSHTSTQSGYKKFHSCETAVMKIVKDTQSKIMKKNCVVLPMLDLSAAFDAVLTN